MHAIQSLNPINIYNARTSPAILVCDRAFGNVVFRVGAVLELAEVTNFKGGFSDIFTKVLIWRVPRHELVQLNFAVGSSFWIVTDSMTNYGRIPVLDYYYRVKCRIAEAHISFMR